MATPNTGHNQSLGWWIVLIAALLALLAAGLYFYLSMTVSLDKPLRRTSVGHTGAPVIHPHRPALASHGTHAGKCARMAVTDGRRLRL